MSAAAIYLGDSMTDAQKCFLAAKKLLQSIRGKGNLRSVSALLQKSAWYLQSSAAIINKQIQKDPSGEKTLELQWPDSETTPESDAPLNIFLDNLKLEQYINDNAVVYHYQYDTSLALVVAMEAKHYQTEGTSLLLFGPESVEKSSMIRSYALEYEWNCLTITPSMILDPWIGKSVHLLEEYFEYAASHEPCIIILDQLDRLVGKTGTGNSEENVTLIKRTLRVQMTKVLENPQVVVIGCTANPNALDRALLSRFDGKLFLRLPSSIQERISILSNLISKFQNNITSNDIEKLAKITERFSESDMETLIKQAHLMSIRKSDGVPDEDICNIFLNKNCLMEAAMNCRPGITNEEFEMFENFNEAHGDGGFKDWIRIEENESGKFSWLWNVFNPRP